MPKKNSPKVIVVTGDVTMDWNLARTRRSDDGAAAWNADDCTRAYWQRGGAALLADLIDAVAAELRQAGKADYSLCEMGAPRDQVLPGDPRFHHSYAMWSLFDYDAKTSRDKNKPTQAWRVQEFLGLDRCRSQSSEIAEWKCVQDDTPAADIIVLDDADLGFRDDQRLWPKALTGTEHRPWILLKMARPVAQGKLWEHLHRNCADRLIVVMSVNDLRLTEVQISRELSWERTAQDLAWELVYNPKLNAISRCAYVVVSFETAGAFLLSRERDPAPAAAHSRKLFFDPAVIEGLWPADHKGGMIGYTSCLAAGIVRQLMIAPSAPDIDAGIQGGLAAMRTLHLEGYGVRGSIAPDARLGFPIETIAAELAKDSSQFAVSKVQGPSSSATGFWTILEDRYSGALESVAEQIVKEGAGGALRGVPLGQFGKLLTVDRREIEGFRSVRTLVGEYCRKQRQKRPLSIAVFGAPGSGKSFGIIEVANSLLPDEIEVLDQFNLSQFRRSDDLLDALHQVRDAGLSGKIPLVFWDEFDSELEGTELGWLRHFLAPMQDGRFQQGQISHPIGRAIFVFAGGTCATMEEFYADLSSDEAREAKKPDFVSRLKGYVNVLGPNRQKTAGGEDRHYILRRAILLRSILTRDAKHLVDERGTLNIDDGVLRAMLYTEKYRHGVRSIESVIAMSQLGDKRRFERSCLPAIDQLDLHVDADDFRRVVDKIEIEGELLERLARYVHDVFRQQLKLDGYKRGKTTDDKRKTHSSLVDFDKLADDEKEQNRSNASDIPGKLAFAGYAIKPARANEPRFNLPGADLEELAEMEHDRWMKAKLKNGWQWGPKTDKPKRLHKDILLWRSMSDEEKAERYTPAELAAIGKRKLPDKEKEKDRVLIRGIPKILAQAGYTIVKVRNQR